MYGGEMIYNIIRDSQSMHGEIVYNMMRDILLSTTYSDDPSYKKTPAQIYAVLLRWRKPI